MPAIQSVSVSTFAAALQTMSHKSQTDAYSVALRSDTRDQYGAVVNVNQLGGGDGLITQLEMKDIYSRGLHVSAGLTADERAIARLSGVYSKALAPVTTALPKVAVGTQFSPATEPAWRNRSVSISTISGHIQIGYSGATQAFSKDLAQRIAGPSATKITPADFARAMPVLTQSERACAEVLFNQLFFSKPLEAPAVAGATPKGRAFSIGSQIKAEATFPKFSGDNSAPRVSMTASRTLSMPAIRGELLVNLATGQVFEPVNGVIQVPVAADGQLSLALMRTTGRKMVLERFDVQTPVEYRSDAKL